MLSGLSAAHTRRTRLTPGRRRGPRGAGGGTPSRRSPILRVRRCSSYIFWIRAGLGNEGRRMFDVKHSDWGGAWCACCCRSTSVWFGFGANGVNGVNGAAEASNTDGADFLLASARARGTVLHDRRAVGSRARPPQAGRLQGATLDAAGAFFAAPCDPYNTTGRAPVGTCSTSSQRARARAGQPHALEAGERV